MWPNRCSSAIDAANEGLKKVAEANEEHMHYVDVGQACLKIQSPFVCIFCL